jgi:hypothetical protein
VINACSAQASSLFAIPTLRCQHASCHGNWQLAIWATATRTKNQEPRTKTPTLTSDVVAARFAIHCHFRDNIAEPRTPLETLRVVVVGVVVWTC